MKVLAIIPARGGSKSVPRKNIANFAGQPLISFTIQEALKTKKITDLVVSSDDEEIISLVRQKFQYSSMSGIELSFKFFPKPFIPSDS